MSVGHSLIPGRKEWGDTGMWCHRCGRLIAPSAGGLTLYADRDCPAEPPLPTPAPAQPQRRVRVYIDTADWWVGAYLGDNHIYVCLLPTLVFRIRRQR